MTGTPRKDWKDRAVYLLIFTLNGLMAGRVSILISGWLGLERYSVGWFLIPLPLVCLVYPFMLIAMASLFGRGREFKERQMFLFRKLLSWLGIRRRD